MQRILTFILRNRIGLLYLLLLSLAIFLTTQNNSYHRSRFFNSANWVSGNLYNLTNSVHSYFDLKEVNAKLAEENRMLRMHLFNATPKPVIDLDTAHLDYEVYTAQIIKNSFSSSNNYITINLGSRNGLKQDMGVITSKGILGILEHTSSEFATVQSILNTKSNINAKIANTNYFGSLTWDGLDFNLVQLQDIPRPVSLHVGDTIVTGAMSSIFPENIPIGVVDTFKIDVSNSYYEIQVRLFNDMTNVKQVYVIYNRKRPEILKLETLIDGE